VARRIRDGRERLDRGPACRRRDARRYRAAVVTDDRGRRHGRGGTDGHHSSRPFPRLHLHHRSGHARRPGSGDHGFLRAGDIAFDRTPPTVGIMPHVPAERCLSIIELLAEGASDLSLGDIAERLELPKSATHRLLSTLVDVGWAEQDAGTSFYRLTM